LFRFWLHFHPLLILLVLALIFAAAGGLIHWLQCRSRFAPRFQKGALAAPTFVAVSTLFALFAGFLLADVMAQKHRALQTVETEGAALLTLGIDSEAARASGGAIRATIHAYAHSVVADEWPQLVQERASAKTEQALSTLLRTVRDGPAADDVKSAVHGLMLTLAQKVAEARAERVAIVSNHVGQLGWSTLFLLGFITQFGLGLAHLDRRPANATAIAFFSCGAVLALWLIAIQDNPFSGPARISPAPIEKVIAMVAAG
jgi:hypothetical protein